jgi:hypothetical protein
MSEDLIIAAGKMATTVSDEHDFMLASLAPSVAQKRLALAVVLVSLVAFFVTTAFLSTIKLPRIDAFIPMYAATMFVNDSITAVLLFAQFSILRSRALLAISGGYLFTALMLIPWMLTFPGVFTPGGLLGAGLQSTVSLYILWHAGFPAFVIGYALLLDRRGARRQAVGYAECAPRRGVPVRLARRVRAPRRMRQPRPCSRGVPSSRTQRRCAGHPLHARTGPMPSVRRG